MSVETPTKDTALAIQYFEAKLNFEIGPVGLKRAIDNKEPIQIVDLRSEELYREGHIPGALNIRLENIADETGGLAKDTTVILYCYDAVCSLSAKAALYLARKGYSVKELSGGFEEWVRHEMPVAGKTQGSSCSASRPDCH